MATNHTFSNAPFERDSLPLDSARTAFEWLVTGPEPLSIDGRFFPGLPRRRVPVDELRELLLDPGLSLPAVDLVWMHLVARSRDEGGAWTVACVGVALPALFAIAAELCARYADDYRDIHASVLTGFLSELASINLAKPWILWRLRCAALRADTCSSATRSSVRCPPMRTSTPANRPRRGATPTSSSPAR